MFVATVGGGGSGLLGAADERLDQRVVVGRVVDGRVGCENEDNDLPRSGTTRIAQCLRLDPHASACEDYTL